MPPIDDTVKGFIEEVQGYIDPITEGIEAYHADTSQQDTLEEAHRLVHTIKGAASMLDFAGLSHVAGEMENVMNDVMLGTLSFSEDVVNALLQVVGQIDTYCRTILIEEVDEKAMVKETITVFRRMRDLPEAGDEEAFQHLWESEVSLEEASSDENEGSIDGANFFNDLVDSFYVEAEEHMENTARFLNLLDSQVREPTAITTVQKDAIKEIRRSVHTVKGAAGMVKLNEISNWAHTIEDVLDWLYEEAEAIDRSMIELLYDATDLLGLFISNPMQVDNDKLDTVRNDFQAVLGSALDESSVGEEGVVEKKAVGEKKQTIEIFEPASERINLEEYVQASSDVTYGKTLRVQMERIDDLVNLGGELSIALSGCEQKMEMFTNTLQELELSRDRLRTIARDLETDYEVKAIQGLGTTLSSAMTGDGNVLQTGVFEEFDSLELDRYSEFNLLIRSLAEAVVDMGAINTQMLSIYSELDGFLNRQRVLLSELQNDMMLIRMTPMSSISNRLRQTIREVSRELGKQVKLVIEGEEIELDRQIWDKIIDPLMHILRNSVDHGIENQARRQELGKPIVGTVRVSAAREGNQVVIRIADDGAGINYEKIREQVIASDIYDSVNELSHEELALMIFQPGFSTSDSVTQLSGRGVGMDVVKENIESLKGTVSVQSLEDQGVQFTIRIPLTLAVAEALLFTLDHQTYAVSLNEVSEVFRIPSAALPDDMEGEVEIEGEVYPLQNLRKIVQRGQTADTSVPSGKDTIVLLLDVGGKKMTVAIEHMIGKREIVIKSLGSHLKHVKGISGATILGDGQVVPILNIEELIGGETIIADGDENDFHPITSKPLEILIVDDSVSVRQVVARLMESQGWKTQTAKDGVEALEKIRDSRPDLIVLDIEMPRMNGYEFLNAINVQPQFKHTPVVMLTSRATVKHREKAMSLGARGFVVKPYRDDEFIEIVMRLTGEEQ